MDPRTRLYTYEEMAKAFEAGGCRIAIAMRPIPGIPTPPDFDEFMERLVVDCYGEHAKQLKAKARERREEN